MIDNIFSALIHEQRRGSVKEFVLWVLVCVVALMAMISAIVGHGSICWIMLLLFALGMGVLMAFRLKAISLLYGAGTFCFLMPIFQFFCYSSNWYGSFEYYSILNILLFVIALLLAIAVVTIGFIHNFSKMQLAKIMTVLLIIDCVVIMFMNIMMYALPYIDESEVYYGEAVNTYVRDFLNHRGYWLGIVSYWMMLVVLIIFFIFFYWGMIDNRKAKIIGNSGGRRQGGHIASGTPGLQCTSGTYVGRFFALNNNEAISIGSGSNVTLQIPDRTVSRQHCFVKYDRNTGFYQVYDSSTYGVFLYGQRIPQNQWYSIKAGSEIAMGGHGVHQFKLV